MLHITFIHWLKRLTIISPLRGYPPIKMKGSVPLLPSSIVLKRLIGQYRHFRKKSQNKRQQNIAASDTFSNFVHLIGGLGSGSKIDQKYKEPWVKIFEKWRLFCSFTIVSDHQWEISSNMMISDNHETAVHIFPNVHYIPQLVHSIKHVIFFAIFFAHWSVADICTTHECLGV